MNWYRIKFLPDNRFVKYIVIWLFILPPISETLKAIVPFSWHLLFLAALCFTIANAIYMLRCPNIIKDHISFKGFIGDKKTYLHLKEYQEEIKDDEDIKSSNDNKNNDNLLKNDFWQIHQKAKAFRPCCLKWCVFFYVIGFLSIAIAIGYQSVKVIKPLF